MNMRIKSVAVWFMLSSSCFTSFAETQYNENALVNSNVNDAQIIIDSNSTGSVEVLVAENISFTANSLNVYGKSSSIGFLGGNLINAENISIYEGSSMFARAATITANKISLEESGASLFLKDCETTVKKEIILAAQANIVIDGGFLQADFIDCMSSYESLGAEIKIINGGSLEIKGKGNNKFQNANIYVDSSSSFSASDKAQMNGTLSFEPGAVISLAKNYDIANASFELVVNDISTLTDKELNEYFETITLAGSSIENLITSENLTVYDKSTNMAYNIRVSENGTITIIPEHSACAAIFCAIALAFAAYRREK